MADTRHLLGSATPAPSEMEPIELVECGVCEGEMTETTCAEGWGPMTAPVGMRDRIYGHPECLVEANFTITEDWR